MDEIEVVNLTKDYGHGRGVFDVSFSVKKGEAFGFLGPNGAGKSTTIRHIMGFSKPQKGETRICGMESFSNYDKIMGKVGYLPGEIALPEGLTGTEFLGMMAELRGGAARFENGHDSHEDGSSFSVDLAHAAQSLRLRRAYRYCSATWRACTASERKRPGSDKRSNAWRV